MFFSTTMEKESSYIMNVEKSVNMLMMFLQKHNLMSCVNSHHPLKSYFKSGESPFICSEVKKVKLYKLCLDLLEINGTYIFMLWV